MSFRRTTLVTGAASGIGRHLASAFASSGDWVLAADIDTEGLRESAKRAQWKARGVRTCELDVTDHENWQEAVDRVLEERDRLDLLVHAAGFLAPGRVVDAEPEAIQRQVDVNLTGTMFGTRVAGAAMADQEGDGHIVNFGSLASLAAVPGIGVYAGTKFGVRGFSLAAAEELREEDVYVTVVMPDAVDTAMLEEEAEFEEASLAFSGTVLTVDDIEAVVFDHVLPHRPLEVAIPRDRGALAKLANLAPGVTRLLRPILERLGRANQQEYRSQK